MFLTVDKNLKDFNTELKTGTNVSRNIYNNLEKRKLRFFVVIWTFAINKLILPDQKGIKKLQVLRLKREKVSLISSLKVGLTLLGIFIQNK